MRFARWRRLLVSALLLVTAGCVCRIGVVEPPPATSREELVSMMGERTRTWSSYQANVHIKGESSKGKFRLRAVIVAQLPDRFRLEAFTPLGQTAGVLVFAGEGARLWLPSERVVYSSPRAETLIRHFLGVPIPVRTFGYSLAASLPPDGRSKEWSPAPALSGWTVRAAESDENLDLTWTLLSRPPAMKTVAVRQGSMDYTIDYEPAAGLAPEQTPGEIRFNSSQWRMEIRVDQMKAQAEIPPSAFDLSVPVEARRVQLGDTL